LSAADANHSGEARRRWSEEEKRAVVAETYVEARRSTAWHVGIRSIPICCLAGASNTARRLNGGARIVVDQFYAGRHAPPEPSRHHRPTVAVAAPLIELEFGAHSASDLWGCRSGFVAAVIKAMPRR